jgi:hydroxypyruvate isomerase
MIRFAANLSTLFTDRPFLERFGAASAAGFAGVEVQFPYGETVGALAAAAEAADVEMTLFNVPAGDLVKGGLGLACVPGRETEFRAAVSLAVEYARVLRPTNVNVLPGNTPPGASREACFATLAANLRLAGDALGAIGVGVVVEPINAFDRPDFCLTTSAAGLEAIERAGHPAVRLQYDVYHMDLMGDGVVEAIPRLAPRIGHIQFADAPGRHEPGIGKVGFPAVFAAIERSGYAGWVGAEYLPSRATEATLGWFAPYRRKTLA